MTAPHFERFDDQRDAMIEEQLINRGISDDRVLGAMRLVPREDFVVSAYRAHAYEDRPLPIGEEQTISQPYIVALMLQLLRVKPDHIVLEIGTGSGYQTALLSRMARRVVSVERIPSLTKRAAAVLAGPVYANVDLRVGDGTRGYEEFAPYNGIVVTAGGPRVPDALASQLAERGRLVCPVGDREKQELVVIERRGDAFERTVHGGCRFVPLIGKDGWDL